MVSKGISKKGIYYERKDTTITEWRYIRLLCIVNLRVGPT